MITIRLNNNDKLPGEVIKHAIDAIDAIDAIIK